jgi:hypothetical protein
VLSEERTLEVAPGPGRTSKDLVIQGHGVRVTVEVRPAGTSLEVRAQACALDRSIDNLSLAVEACADGWSQADQLFMPGAVYAGNRFDYREIGYPTMFREPHRVGPDAIPCIGDVPRLGRDSSKPSRIQQLAGDLSIPVIALFFHNRRVAWLLSGPQRAGGGACGYQFDESIPEHFASARVVAPGVRERHRYFICNTSRASEDRGATVSPEHPLELTARIEAVHCEDVLALMRTLFERRRALCELASSDEPQTAPDAPLFSVAAEIVSRKHQQSNWDESLGMYRTGVGNDACVFWQIGWVGGMMPTLAFLDQGDDRLVDRVCRNLDWLFAHGQAESGLFKGILRSDLQSIGDGFEHPGTQRWLLSRKVTDGLLFVLRHLRRLKSMGRSVDKWSKSTRRCAEALAYTWERHGQWGQIIDDQTGEVLVGGSTSASTGPAAMALASVYFNEPRFLRIAEDSGRTLHRLFVTKGYTCGGPGEALQCPDSESAFGLLESMVELHQVTGDPVWIGLARDTAHLCALWCCAYDFAFPPASTFGRLAMRSRGTVFANVQNKHAAPGICTLSGASLLHLFRATGDEGYIELLREVAGAIPQYVSREDRPIGKMPPGWVNERVNTSDWLEPVGEIFNGSCWCEVSMLLTHLEVPGVYARRDLARVWAIDRVQASWIEKAGTRQLCVVNPTRWPARISVMIDDGPGASRRAQQLVLDVAPGERGWAC